MKSSRTSAKAPHSKSDTKLVVAMTGKASPVKAAEGDRPVFAYIASLPQPQPGIAERIDALAAEQPEPPVTPVGMGKSARVVELATASAGARSRKRPRTFRVARQMSL